MKTILLLDDNPCVLQILGMVLRSKGGHRVLEATSLPDAIDQLEREAVDLLIADVCLKENEGPEFREQLRTLSHHVPVLFMSGYTRDHLINNGLLDRDAVFIAKPFLPETLLKRVGEVLNASGDYSVEFGKEVTKARVFHAGGQLA